MKAYISRFGLTSKHPFVTAWYNLLNRCNRGAERHNASSYTDARCDWKNFYEFHRDMFPSWRKGLTLDRKDNNKGYSVDNCRRDTPTEQQRNRTNNVLSEGYADRIRDLGRAGISMADRARYLGLSYNSVYHVAVEGCWSTAK